VIETSSRQASPDPLTEIERLSALGIVANDEGKHATALRLFQRTLRRIDELDRLRRRHDERDDIARLRARTWISVATCESELNGHQAGLAALDTARGYLEVAEDRHLQFLLLSQTGYMTVRGGEVDSGLRSLERAEQLVDHATSGEAYILYLNRGTTYLFARQLSRAARDFRRAQELAEANDWTTESRMVQHNLGYLAYLKGNLAQALTVMEDHDDRESAIFRAVVLLDRSQVLIEAGLHREADLALHTASDLFRSERLWNDVGRVELARAECALLAGEFVAARRLAVGARRRFRRRGNDRLQREAELLVFQAEVAGELPHRNLSDDALALAADFRASGLPSHAQIATLIAAEAAARAGRPTTAADIAAQAGPIRPHDSISVRAHTRVVRAQLSAESGQVARAKREVTKGLSELAHHQARFGSVDMQTAGAVHGQKLVGLDLALALTSSKPRALFDAIERGRAVASRLSHVTAPLDGDAAELLGALRQTTSEIRSIESDPAASASVAVLRKQIAEIQDRLRAKSWAFEGTDAVRPPASLDEVSAHLSEQSATLITVAKSGSSLFAVVVSSRDVRRIDLGNADPAAESARTIRASLDVLATGQVVAPIRQSIERSLARALTYLDDVVVRSASVDGGRVVLSLAGDLATVPWGLAPSLRGRPVVVVPSASAWIEAAHRTDPAGPSSVAIFSGPGLRHAEREAAAVRDQWKNAELYEGDLAQRASLASAIRTKSVIHVAAHGQHQPENPLFSYVQMHDGPLYAYELERSDRCAEHVVLSACEVGAATIRPGDEPLGLTSVLLRLGARSVVSGVARIHDQVAADVMTAYHRQLAAGIDSAESLADAMSTSTDLPAPFGCFGSSWALSAR
jgi:hypothetical protein